LSYQDFTDRELKELADKGDIEARIYLDTRLGHTAMLKNRKAVPDEALQAMKRSADRLCPISQLNLAVFWMEANPHDKEALSLLLAAAEAGYCRAQSKLGRPTFSKLKENITRMPIMLKKLFVGM
jgi:TPR repeat protein